MSETTEKWLPYNEFILVSNTGKVESLITKHEYVTQDNGRGYLSVSARHKGVVVREYVHRMVAKTFIENKDNKPEVNHIDFNKSNNHVDNLEWVTKKENMQHNVKGNRVNTIKANDYTRQPIIVYDIMNKTYYYFKDSKTGSKFFNLNSNRFSHIFNRHDGKTKRFIITRIK